jgi:hypothetical protein
VVFHFAARDSVVGSATIRRGTGALAGLVDFTSDGRAIGVEFLDMHTVNLAELNRVVTAAHQPALSDGDLMPLEAA